MPPDDDLAHLPLLNPADLTSCFVCGPDNPHGLALRIHRDGDEAVARYTPPAHQEGYPGRFHGGLVGLLVDEMLVYAGAVHGLYGMTARVAYRLRTPLAPGETLTLRSRMTRGSGRGFQAEVRIYGGDGRVAATGEGTCVAWDGTP
jgi:hypothetical protein